MFNVRLHPCIEVYVIHRRLRKFNSSRTAANASNRQAVVTKMRRSFWNRHRWLVWTGGGLLLVLLALVTALAILARRAEPYLRARIVAALSQHFHSRVELDTFHVALVNGLHGEWGIWAEGRGLRIWPPAQVAGVAVPGSVQPDEPLIRLQEFRFHAPLRYHTGLPVQISIVQLRGLDVDLPSRVHFQHLRQGLANQGPGNQPGSNSGMPRVTFQIGSIECTGANLRLETSKPGKLPVTVAIAHFKLTGITPTGSMDFDAQLTNPRPRGIIHTSGRFGPWRVNDPGESPVEGDYRLDHADLGTFRGIAGILSSIGHYQGTLRDLTVDGETDTPDFQLSLFRNPLPLHTHFHAKVDGTNGDTWLDPVDATQGLSHLIAQGHVVRVIATEAGRPPHSIGHDIALNVTVDRAHIEDFLRLLSHGVTPLMTGDLALKTTLHIPPGPVPVHRRLQLNGSFKLDDAQFTSPDVQHRIRELSLRGRGRPGDLKAPPSATIQSHMQGDFQMAHGVITLPALQYTVPGAQIQLKGTYTVDGGDLDFVGTARTQATVSEMVGGWKGMLLKPADRFFRKDGAGAQIPIHIGGTREHPDFGIDLDRLKTTSPQRPDQMH
jgi:hypothetical protein